MFRDETFRKNCSRLKIESLANSSTLAERPERPNCVASNALIVRRDLSKSVRGEIAAEQTRPGHPEWNARLKAASEKLMNSR